jgi:branched-chain amino acid transport system ATP-binding protein
VPLLEIQEVSKRFGGITANDSVSLRVGEWEIVGLIGPNGAGKTTLFNCICGVYPVNSGHILYKAQDITGLKTHERAELGIGRSFQNLGLVRGTTVLQNLISAQHMTVGYTVMEGMVGAPVTFSEERELMYRADRILDFTELKDYRDATVDDLSYGVLKKVELATVLATDPELLMLDEPSSGLSPTESDHLGDILLRLREELTVTILMIEHHVPLVVRVCDYVYVLNFGQLLAEGLPQEIQRHPEVIAAYLGEEELEDGSVASVDGQVATEPESEET